MIRSERELTQVVIRLISLPRDFNRLDDTSFFDLIQRSGYLDTFDQIDEKMIAQAVTSMPNYIMDWLNWSENKRVNSGWYFKAVGLERYAVGFASVLGDFKSLESDNVMHACAVYIKNEIENIRLGYW